MSETNNSGRKKAGIAVAALAGLVAAGGVGAGLNALFTDTQSIEAEQYSTGTVELGDFKNGVASTEFNTKVENLAAGDTTYRLFTVKNAGTLEFGKIEAKITTNGPLAGKGVAPTDSRKDPQVNGDSSVGAGDTPLEMGIAACVNGKWNIAAPTSSPATNADGTKNVEATCNGGTRVDLTDDFKKTTDGVANLTPMTDFNGEGKNVVLFNKRTTVDDKGGESGGPIADKADVNPGKEVSYLVTYHLPKAAKNEYQNTTADTTVQITATQREGQTFEATTAQTTTP